MRRSRRSWCTTNDDEDDNQSASAEQTTASDSTSDPGSVSVNETNTTTSSSTFSTPGVCRICGDKAYGCNFSVLTCESCKAFFRRHALNSKKFQCVFNDCPITVKSRRYCAKCRLRKCFEEGMRKDFIWSAAALMERRNNRKNKKMLALQQQKQPAVQSVEAQQFWATVPGERTNYADHVPQSAALGSTTGWNTDPLYDNVYQTTSAERINNVDDQPVISRQNVSLHLPVISANQDSSHLNSMSHLPLFHTATSNLSQQPHQNNNDLLHHYNQMQFQQQQLLNFQQQQQFLHRMRFQQPAAVKPPANVQYVSHQQQPLNNAIERPDGLVTLNSPVIRPPLPNQHESMIDYSYPKHPTDKDDFVYVSKSYLLRLIDQSYSPTTNSCLNYGDTTHTRNGQIANSSSNPTSRTAGTNTQSPVLPPMDVHRCQCGGAKFGFRPATPNAESELELGEIPKKKRALDQSELCQEFLTKQPLPISQPFPVPVTFPGIGHISSDADGRPRAFSVPRLTELLNAVRTTEAKAFDISDATTNQHSLLDKVIENHLRRIIHTWKQVKSFSNLGGDDQVALLKAACTELLLLRAVALSNKKEHFQFVEHLMRHNEIKRTFQLFRKSCYADDYIMASANAIVLFNPEIQKLALKSVIETERHLYQIGLRNYLEATYHKDDTNYIISSLLNNLDALRLCAIACKSLIWQDIQNVTDLIMLEMAAVTDRNDK